MRYRRWVFWSGVLLIVCGLLTALQIPFFYLRNDLVSERLLASVSTSATETNNVSSGNGDATDNPSTADSVGNPSGHVATNLTSAHNIQLSPARVQSAPVIPLASRSQGGLLAVLEIPKLGLVAPVLEGTDDAVLNVAVGHLGDSSAPGQPGVSELSAHNATWFRHIDQLNTGDKIDVKTTSGTYVYRVTGHEVVQTTDTVQSTALPRLILEACYPLDALYLTQQRFLVEAELEKSLVSPTIANENQTSTSSKNELKTGLKAELKTGLSTDFTASVPRDLQSEGLLLHENNLPLGTLTYSHMDASFTQSESPLHVTNAMVQLVEAFLHASADENDADLSALFPSLSQSGSTLDDRLYGVDARTLRFTTPLSLHISGQGTQVQSVIAQVGIEARGQEVTMTLSATGSTSSGTGNVTTLTLEGVSWK